MLLGRVGRAGLPGAFWCAHLFLWPLFLSALLGPLRAGVAPLSLAAVAVRRCLGAVFWLFFWASRCVALRALSPRLCLPLGRWLLSGGCCPPPPPLLCLAVFVAPAWCLGVFFFFFFFLCAPPLSPAFSGFRARVPLATALCVVCFVGLPLLGSACAFPSFVLSAWLLAAPWWLLEIGGEGGNVGEGGRGESGLVEGGVTSAPVDEGAHAGGVGEPRGVVVCGEEGDLVLGELLGEGEPP